jgi:hypothetical protein
MATSGAKRLIASMIFVQSAMKKYLYSQNTNTNVKNQLVVKLATASNLSHDSIIVNLKNFATNSLGGRKNAAI